MQVPALAIGEMLQLRNVFDWPRWQAIMTRRLGFPFPWMMVGRWGLSPLPRKVPLHYIVGDPIAPPPHTPGACRVQDTCVHCCRLHAWNLGRYRCITSWGSPSRRRPTRRVRSCVFSMCFYAFYMCVNNQPGNWRIC